MAIELVSFSDLATLLDLSNTEPSYPDLTLIQNKVVDAFEEHTRRSFENINRVETRYPSPFETKMIQLKGIPVNTVNSITCDGESITGYKITAYGIQLDTSIIDKTIVVDYDGGLAVVPGNLNRAALLQTAYEFQNKDSIGISTTSTDGGSVTKPEVGMLKEVKQLLSKFVHPFVVF